jgi:hypothetical protein
MIDFKWLDNIDNYLKLHNLKKLNNDINKKLPPLQYQWFLENFLNGLLNRPGFELLEATPIYDTISIIPTNNKLNYTVLKKCKEGIQEFYLDELKLNLKINILPIKIPELEFFSSVSKKIKEKKVWTKDLNYVGNILRNCKKVPNTYNIFIDNADFFIGENKRVVGKGHRNNGNVSLLDRGYYEGRYLDGKKISLNDNEKETYFKNISAHEIYHAIGGFPDIKKGYHEMLGYPDNNNCRAYSQTETIDSKFCECCKDGIRSYWYGISKRLNKKFITQ